MKRNGFPIGLVPAGIVLAATAALRAEPVEFRVETAGGSQVVGAPTALDGETLTLTTSDGPVTVPTAELMTLSSLYPGTAPSDDAAVWIRLTDGSKLEVAGWALDGATGRVTLLDGREVEVPRRALQSVRFQPAAGPIAEQWAQMVDGSHDGDVVVIRRDDHLDFLRGIIRSVTEESVAFEMDGDVLPVRRGRLFGAVLLQPAGRELPSALCQVADNTGSQWSVRSLALAADGELEWTTPAGVFVTRPLASVAAIDFSVGRVVYLADLQPHSVDWQPFFPMDKELPSRREFFRPRSNRGLESDVLELDGVQYERGLAMHSRTEVVYRLPDEMTRLRATAGIDDRVRPLGNVLLVIRGNDKTLFEGTLTGTDPPVELDLDITGVRRLSILCDFGEGMDIADHLNLCNLRVIR